MNYYKLLSHLVKSSLWGEDSDTRVLWITLLAVADHYGEVISSVPGLARVSNLSPSAVAASLERLKEPDEFSANTDEDGRRIVEIDGGWRIVSYTKYRTKMRDEERKESARIRQREYRLGRALLEDELEAVGDEDEPNSDENPDNKLSPQSENSVEKVGILSDNSPLGEKSQVIPQDRAVGFSLSLQPSLICATQQGEDISLGFQRAGFSRKPAPVESPASEDSGRISLINSAPEKLVDKNTSYTSEADFCQEADLGAPLSPPQKTTQGEASQSPSTPKLPEPAQGPQTSQNTNLFGEPLADEDPVYLRFPCRGPKKEWHLTQAYCRKMQARYPDLNLIQEFKSMLTWIEANPTRRKTSSGMPAFVANWLTKACNKPWRAAAVVQQPSSPPIQEAKDDLPDIPQWLAEEAMARSRYLAPEVRQTHPEPRIESGSI